jgi:predicted kinase
MPLFLSVRAAIRAHVLFMKSEQAGGDDAVWLEAKRYFDLAGRLIAPKPPLLVAIGGLSGTGKSVLARGLAGLIEPPPGAVIIRSDVVRKHLFGVGETTALPETAYRSDVTERVYGLLSSTARRILGQGCSVVLDAAYLQEAERAEIATFAGTYGIRFVGLFLTADLATRLARIENRRGDASDATRSVVLTQETFAIGAVDWHIIDASGTPDQSLRSARTSLFAVPDER